MKAMSWPTLRQLATWMRELVPQGWSKRMFAGHVDRADQNLPPWSGHALAALTLCMFLFQLQQPLLDPDEGRQAEIPRVMLDTGDWLVPSWRGKAYHEKPPLNYWLTACIYAVLGVSPASARLVPAGAACLSVLLTYRWGRRALGRRPALLGSLILCLTPGFFLLGRTVLLDSVLTLLVVAGWTCGQRAFEFRLQWRWWLLGALMCGAGILQKGPVAVVLILVPLWLYARLNATTAKVGWRALFAFVLLAVGVALPWYVAMALREPGYVEAFLWRSNVVRFVQPFDHARPWWFYVPVLAVGALPWSLLLPGVLVFLGSSRLAPQRPGGLGLMVLAFGWCLLFYSLSGCKSPPYLMPLFPPLALVLGAFFNALLFHELPMTSRLLSWTRATLPLIIAPAMLLVAPVALYIPSLFDRASAWFLVSGLVSVVALLLAWWLRVRTASAPAAWGFVAILTLLTLMIPVRQSIWAVAARRSPESMVQVVRPLLRDPETRLVLFDRQWPSAHFYLGQQHLPHFDQHTQEYFVQYARQALAAQPRLRLLVLVDNGAKVENLVKILPAGLTVTVEHPPGPHQPALLILQDKSHYSCAGERPGTPLPFRPQRL